jgi:flagellar motor protein MotB
VVVADVLVGFLCVVLLLFIAYVRPAGDQPPAAVAGFGEKLQKHKHATGGRYEIKPEFSKVHVSYGEKLLFQTCEWHLSEAGRTLLKEHLAMLGQYAAEISRIQIEGHADTRRPDRCESLKRVGLRRDNWILSSLRALEVRDFLEGVFSGDVQDGAADRAGQSSSDLVKKIEAVGRGDLHPIDPSDPASEVNRRLEVTVNFIERPLSR